MSDERERAELLAALHAAGAASPEDEQELEALLDADPSLRKLVREFEDSITALAASFEPVEAPRTTLLDVQREISPQKQGVLARLRQWLSKR